MSHPLIPLPAVELPGRSILRDKLHNDLQSYEYLLKHLKTLQLKAPEVEVHQWVFLVESCEQTVAVLQWQQNLFTNYSI